MLQTLSGPAVLLVWLYVMANVIVLGAEVNFHLARVRRAPVERQRDGAASSGLARARARCEFRRFQASPISATVRSSPAGTKIGS